MSVTIEKGVMMSEYCNDCGGWARCYCPLWLRIGRMIVAVLAIGVVSTVTFWECAPPPQAETCCPCDTTPTDRD